MGIYGRLLLEKKMETSNKINYPIIHKNGKKYTYKPVNKETLIKISKCIDICKKCFKELNKSEEFKICASAMKDNKIFNLTVDSLTKDIEKSFIEQNGKYYIDISISNNDISQDIAYYEYSKNKCLLNITDNILKTKIRKLVKEECNADLYIGDDYYGFDIYVLVYNNKQEADENLVEI